MVEYVAQLTSLRRLRTVRVIEQRGSNPVNSPVTLTDGLHGLLQEKCEIIAQNGLPVRVLNNFQCLTH